MSTRRMIRARGPRVRCSAFCRGQVERSGRVRVRPNGISLVCQNTRANQDQLSLVVCQHGKTVSANLASGRRVHLRPGSSSHDRNCWFSRPRKAHGDSCPCYRRRNVSACLRIGLSWPWQSRPNPCICSGATPSKAGQSGRSGH